MTELFFRWERDGFPEPDKMRYDAAWELFIRNLWRVTGLGIPSVFK